MTRDEHYDAAARGSAELRDNGIVETGLSFDATLGAHRE
jgi:hypothetical protein